jgi:hypothetical protein
MTLAVLIWVSACPLLIALTSAPIPIALAVLILSPHAAVAIALMSLLRSALPALIRIALSTALILILTTLISLISLLSHCMSSVGQAWPMEFDARSVHNAHLRVQNAVIF